MVDGFRQTWYTALCFLLAQAEEKEILPKTSLGYSSLQQYKHLLSWCRRVIPKLEVRSKYLQSVSDSRTMHERKLVARCSSARVWPKSPKNFQIFFVWGLENFRVHLKVAIWTVGAVKIQPRKIQIYARALLIKALALSMAAHMLSERNISCGEHTVLEARVRENVKAEKNWGTTWHYFVGMLFTGIHSMVLIKWITKFRNHLFTPTSLNSQNCNCWKWPFFPEAYFDLSSHLLSTTLLSGTLREHWPIGCNSPHLQEGHWNLKTKLPRMWGFLSFYIIIWLFYPHKKIIKRQNLKITWFVGALWTRSQPWKNKGTRWSSKPPWTMARRGSFVSIFLLK